MPRRRTEDFGDFIGNYNFRVEIDGVLAGHFKRVEGLCIEQEVIERQDDNDPVRHKRPGRIKYGDITLKRGYIASSVFKDWIEAARVGKGDQTRKKMSIVLCDKSNSEIKRWNCFECFPKSWNLASLDGKGNDVLTEEMVIVIEWFEEA